MMKCRSEWPTVNSSYLVSCRCISYCTSVCGKYKMKKFLMFLSPSPPPSFLLPLPSTLPPFLPIPSSLSLPPPLPPSPPPSSLVLHPSLLTPSLPPSINCTGCCQASDMYVDQLKDVLNHSCPKRIAAFFAEPIQACVL